MMNQILEHLTQPEYMHVLINPMPVYGLSMGIVAMIVALIYRGRPVIVAALVLMFLAGLSAWPTYHYGQEAYDRVKSMSDTVGGQWLDEHMKRAEKLIYAFYILAGVAMAGIFAPLKWPRTSMPLAISALVLGIATLGIGGWISYPAGHVRHKEFRFEPPPTAEAEEHTHTHNDQSGTDHEATHADHTKAERTQPMDHGTMPGMESDPKEQPVAATRDQLEASRMQLEASRLQLEASRKQLEATDAAKARTGSPLREETASPHVEDGHPHEHKS